MSYTKQVTNDMLSDSAMRRRLKRKFNRSEQHFFIPCAPGLEQILFSEVQTILANADFPAQVEAAVGGVSVSAHIHAMYHCNLAVRTGNRMLLRIEEFWADSLPALHSQASRISWEAFLGHNTSVAVRASSIKSRLTTGRSMIESVVAAINVRFDGLRPAIVLSDEVSNEIPTVYVRVAHDRVTVSIDTTGDHLFKRGYRSRGATAPIRPTLAAAMVSQSRWAGDRPLLDPFCGSGTIAIEALMQSEGIPAGLKRPFAFEQLPFHNDSLWQRLRRSYSPVGSTGATIVAADIDPQIVAVARQNAAAVESMGKIRFLSMDAFRLTARGLGLTEEGVIVTNFPYGKRVTTGAAPPDFIAAALRTLRRSFPGWYITLAAPVTHSDWSDLDQQPRTIKTKNGGLPIQITSGKLKL